MRIVSGVCANLLDRGLAVEIFGAVPLAALVPPGGAGLGDVELGQLVGDVRVGEAGNAWKLVAEADPVIEQPENERHPALGCLGLVEADGELVIMVADRPIFAPRLFPGLVEAAGGLAGHDEIAEQLRSVGEQEAEAALVDHGLAVPRDEIADAAFAVERYVDVDHVRRRVRAGDDRRSAGRGLRRGRNGDEAQNGGGNKAKKAHPISSMTAA